MPVAGRTNKRIAKMLVKRGFLKVEDMDHFIEQAEKTQRSITTYVIEEQLVSEPDVLSAISQESGMTPINLDHIRFDKQVVETLPMESAQTYDALVISKVGNFITLALANPFDLYALDDIKKLTECEIIPVVTTDYSIKKHVNRAYREEEEKLQEFYNEITGTDDSDLQQIEQEDDEDIDISIVTDEESPVVKLVNIIISNALKRGASDIHVEPFEKRIRLRYRIDGICHDVEPVPPKKMQNAISSRLKIMSELDIAERRKPQDGKFRLRFEGREVDFRVSVLPTVHGEKIVMRILDASSLKLSLNDLGFEDKPLEDFRNACNAPYGMVLVTGPTGSGKSTTLYSAIKEVMNDEQNITTVEDPVEYQLEGVNQVPVNPKRGVTFAGALRSILRQDPDIVMIGEIRDLETAQIGVKAALTGHLVFSTLHTNDSPSSVTRLVDMGIDPFMVSSSVLLCSAQRLGRKLCKYCKEEIEVPEERLLSLGAKPEDLERFGTTIFRAKGCSRCTNGYKGRFALLETLPMTERVRRVIVNNGTSMDIKDAGLEEGMLTLRRVGMINALKGVASLENVITITMDD
ncbi:MAG: ATPase, T2SS/T4P/T4SS family [Planctomycetota bacterium]|nr:ATPase, T2SS/T4P/T4SS family [Planctomycetota bacterium]